MRRLFQDEPVDVFQIPQAAQPKAVTDAETNFKRLSSEYADVKSQIAEAMELRHHEIGRAHAAAATARVEGTKPPAERADKVEANWDAKLDALLAERGVLVNALDQAGDTLVTAIGENKEEWVEALAAADEAATERLAKALDAARVAVADLLPARSAVWFVHDFSTESALSPHGSQTQYPGGQGMGGTTAAFGTLDKLVTPEQRLVGYTAGRPIFEDVIFRG